MQYNYAQPMPITAQPHVPITLVGNPFRQAQSEWSAGLCNCCDDMGQCKWEANGKNSNKGQKFRYARLFLLAMFPRIARWQNQRISYLLLLRSERTRSLSHESSIGFENSSKSFPCDEMQINHFAAQGDACDDCIMVTCCQLCVGLQMRNELKNHGLAWIQKTRQRTLTLVLHLSDQSL